MIENKKYLLDTQKEHPAETKEEANLSTGWQPAQNGDNNESDDNGINLEPEQKHQDAGPKIENADEDEQNPFPDEMRPNWHK